MESDPLVLVLANLIILTALYVGVWAAVSLMQWMLLRIQEYLNDSVDKIDKSWQHDLKEKTTMKYGKSTGGKAGKTKGKNPHSAKKQGYVTGQADKRTDSKDAKRIAAKPC